MERKMHRNNLLNVIHDHSFNVQKISKTKIKSGPKPV